MSYKPRIFASVRIYLNGHISLSLHVNHVFEASSSGRLVHACCTLEHELGTRFGRLIDSKHSKIPRRKLKELYTSSKVKIVTSTKAPSQPPRRLHNLQGAFTTSKPLSDGSFIIVASCHLPVNMDGNASRLKIPCSKSSEVFTNTYRRASCRDQIRGGRLHTLASYMSSEITYVAHLLSCFVGAC